MTEHEPATDYFQPADHLIRPGTMDDIEAMAFVYERATAAAMGDIPPDTPRDIIGYIELRRQIIRPDAWAHVVDGPAGTMAGFVLGHSTHEAPHIDYDPHQEYLAELMIEPTLWGRGIGTALLRAAERTATEKDRRSMTLWTRDINTRAQELYSRHGYKLSDRRTGLFLNYILNLEVARPELV